MKYTKETKQFIKKVFIFLSPILIIFFILEYFAYTAGETWNLKKVMAFQNNSSEQVLFNRKAIDDEMVKFKYLNILERKPEVLIVGSSRCMQARHEMFSKDLKFYNAGGMVHNIGGVLDFIKNLPEDKSPKILFLSISHYWFGTEREVTPEITDALEKKNAVYRWENHLYADKYLLTNLLFNNRNIFKEILAGVDIYSGTRSLGLQAISGNGFRYDGSYQYGVYIDNYKKKLEYVDNGAYLIRIEKGTSMFKRNSNYDEERINKLKEFLQICKKRNIRVIGYLPPMAIEVYDAVMASEYHQDLLVDVRENLPSIFEQKEFKFYDFTKIKKLGLTNLYMFDGMHPTETAIATILLEISKDSDLTNILVPDLEEKLNNEQTTTFQINWE